VEPGRLVLLWLADLIIEHLALMYKDLQTFVSDDKSVLPPRARPLYFSALFWQRFTLPETGSTLYGCLDLYGTPLQQVALGVNEDETTTAS
jgi:hypothetical protein